jgi:hypothetical protein
MAKTFFFSRMELIRDEMKNHPEYEIKADPEPNKISAGEGGENKENAKPLKSSNIPAAKNQTIAKKNGPKKTKKTEKNWAIPQMEILSEGFLIFSSFVKILLRGIQ